MSWFGHHHNGVGQGGALTMEKPRLLVGYKSFQPYPTLLLGEDGCSPYKVGTCTLKAKTSEKKRTLPSPLTSTIMPIMHRGGGG